jgi:trigger factor
MAVVEGCKHSIDITVPVTEVQQETDRVVAGLQAKVRLPGFRPGKAPVGLVKSRFKDEIRQEVLESLVPKHFRKAVEKEDLHVVGRPDVTEVHFHEGEPLKFKAEFEVAPTFELGEYRGINVGYSEPEITDEDVNKRLDQIRDQKADFVSVDPRPIVEGDHAVVALESISGAAEPIKNDELLLHVGDASTLPEFTNNLIGAQPDEQREFEVTYPEDYDRPALAGRTVKFKMTVKAIRRKELPEANDEFAKDLGDYQSLEELKEEVRKGLTREREFEAQQKAKQELIDRLVDQHDFPVPDAFVDRQIENIVENQLTRLAAQGVDPRGVKLDWSKVKESQGERARREVKATLLLDKIADRESIDATQEEVDREVQRISKQRREAVAVTRAKLQKEGTLSRIASHIRTDKTLNFLFEQARKEAR